MSDKTSNDAADALSGEVLPPMLQGQSATELEAQISQQVATARRFPRRRDQEISDTIAGRACLDLETAEECIYSVPRAGKEVTGPSIRFAEIVFQAWGNARLFGWVTDVNRDSKTLVAQGVYLDLETNAAIGKSVQRGIATSSKQGKPRLYSEDMIITTGNAAIAIAMREAILRGIPRAVWRKGWLDVIKVVAGDAKTLVQRRTMALERFAKLGVSAEQVYAELEVKDQSDIDLEMMPTLFGLYNAVKQGERKADSVGRAPGPQHHVVENALQDDAPQSQQGGERASQGAREPAGAGQEAAGSAAQATATDRAAGPAPASGGPQAAKGASTPLQAAQGAPAEKIAQALASAPPMGHPEATCPDTVSNDGYAAWGFDWLKAATKRADVDRWWKLQRPERKRRELSAEQLNLLDQAREQRGSELGE